MDTRKLAKCVCCGRETRDLYFRCPVTGRASRQESWCSECFEYVYRLAERDQYDMRQARER